MRIVWRFLGRFVTMFMLISDGERLKGLREGSLRVSFRQPCEGPWFTKGI